MKTLLEAGLKMGGEAVSDSDATAPSWDVEGRGELNGVHLPRGFSGGVVEHPLDEVLVRSLIESKGEETASVLAWLSVSWPSLYGLMTQAVGLVLQDKSNRGQARRR